MHLFLDRLRIEQQNAAAYRLRRLVGELDGVLDLLRHRLVDLLHLRLSEKALRQRPAPELRDRVPGLRAVRRVLSSGAMLVSSGIACAAVFAKVTPRGRSFRISGDC